MASPNFPVPQPVSTPGFSSMLLADKPEELFNFDGIDGPALRQKYRQERDKRLNPKGNDQYFWIQDDDGAFGAVMLKDPWTKPLVRAPLQTSVRVLVIGGGFSGQIAGRRLREAGIDDFLITEKAGDYGGTWYWNRYPGAACDSEAYCYLPYLEETGTRAPEILEHCQRMGRHWNLYEKTWFQTQVVKILWDDTKHRWICETDRNDVITAQFVLSCSGPLHKPKLVVPGADKFKGHQFHTSRWDYNYTGGDSFGNLHKLADKTVAIVGTGATSIQCIPYLGLYAKHLYVFQRTPSSVDERNNRFTDPTWWKEYTKQKGWQVERDVTFAKIMVGMDVKEDLVNDGWTDVWRYTKMLMQAKAEGHPALAKFSNEDLVQLADDKKMNKIRARVHQIVKDQKTAEALCPWYNRMCKRPTFSDLYLPTFNRPNVTLVDTNGKGIEAVTENGIVANGTEYPVDLIVWGTGFEFGTSWKSRNGFDIFGRNGITLQQKWRKGFKSLFGIMTREFPNFAMTQPAQASASINFPFVFEYQIQWFVHVVKMCKERGIEVADVTEQAEKDWTEEIVRKSVLQKEFLSNCSPGY